MTTLPHNSLLFFLCVFVVFAVVFFLFSLLLIRFGWFPFLLTNLSPNYWRSTLDFGPNSNELSPKMAPNLNQKGEKKKNSLYRFILWTAVNIYKTEYTSCCRSLLPPLWIWITRLFVQKCSWADVCIVYDGLVPISNKRDLTQNFICKNYSFLVMFCI